MFPHKLTTEHQLGSFRLIYLKHNTLIATFQNEKEFTGNNWLQNNGLNLFCVDDLKPGIQNVRFLNNC